MNYKTVDLKHVSKSVLVDSLLYNGLLVEVEIAQNTNTQLYKEATAQYNQLQILAAQIWGLGKKEQRIIRNMHIPIAPNFQVDLRRLEREREKELNAIKSRAKNAEYRKNYKARSAGAKGDLLAAGFIEYEDFYPYRAITDRERLMEQVDGVWQRRSVIGEPTK